MNYKEIRKICDQASELTHSAIDAFLIYYAAQQDKLAKEAERQIEKYKHVTREQDPQWVTFMKVQYIAHRVFQNNGLISKYLKHSALKDLTADEMNYLRQQATTPWRFCFSEIVDNPQEDFYKMEDILSDETFLLYSPGTKDILKRSNKTLWFNLIYFNGTCWQTFGPINGYNNFSADDIFFFATEINPELETEADIIKHIEINPIPYMLLFSGSELPSIGHKNQLILLNHADYNMPLSAAQEKLKENFKIDTIGHITRYRLKRWDSFPHFATFYYDSPKKWLHLKAMTNKGFAKLTEKMKAVGIPVLNEPDISVTPTMLSTAEDILNKKIELDEYDDLFQVEPNPAETEASNELNELVQLIVPYLNAGKEPNISRLMQQTGFDKSQIEDVVAQMQKVVDRMR